MPEPPEVTTNQESDVALETGNDSVSLITELIDSEMKNINEDESEKTKGEITLEPVSSLSSVSIV